jgi:hypothetical protein
MDKYYTPSIEEIYFGFEFEINNSFEYYFFEGAFGWHKSVIDYGCLGDLKNLTRLIIDKQIRVKYLDREDIESLGWYSEQILDIWKESSEFELGYSFDITKEDLDSEAHLMYDDDTHIARIYRADTYDEITGNWTQHILFHGTLKNKSELKKLMSMLDIK